MRNNIFTTILFILSITTCVGNSIQSDYKEFYRFTNRAELLIVEENFKGAHQIYLEAFKKWPDAPSIDYYNALLCAAKTRNYVVAFSYMEKLALNGWELDYFMNNPYLSEMRNEKNWKKFIKKYPQLHKSYLESFDIELMTELDSMLTKDQSLVKSKKYTEYLKTVISNANRIYELINNEQTDNIHFGSVYSILYSPFPIVLLRHYCGIYNEAKKGYIDVTNIINDTIKLVNLKEALLLELDKGHLSPLVYDLAVTYSDNANLHGNDLFLEVDSIIIRRNLKPEEEKQINKKRSKIGQESIQDYIRKMEFKNQVIDDNLKKYFFKFKISSSYTLITGKPEQLKKFINDRLDQGWIKVTP